MKRKIKVVLLSLAVIFSMGLLVGNSNSLTVKAVEPRYKIINSNTNEVLETKDTLAEAFSYIDFDNTNVTTNYIVEVNGNEDMTATSAIGGSWRKDLKVLLRSAKGKNYTIKSYTNQPHIKNNGATLTIQDLTLDGDNKSGGINQSTISATLIVEDGTIIKNCVLDGAINASRGSHLVINGGKFFNNDQPLDVGTITIQDNGSTFIMNGGEIYDNTAKIGGGVCSYMGATFTMKGGKIYGNTAKWGGGVAVRGSVGFTSYKTMFIMEDGIIDNNYASIYGGGIYAYNPNNLTIEEQELLSVSIEGGEVTNNTAIDYGGGLYGKFSTLNLKNTTISSNSIEGEVEYNARGGGIYTDSSSLIIDNTIITNNKIKGENAHKSFGGGLSLWNYTTATISNSTISNNEVKSNYRSEGDGGVGGGIAMATNSILTLQGTLINNNSAESGGGISTTTNNQIELQKDVMVSENKALGNANVDGLGGGVYLYNTDSLIMNSNARISENSAAYGGGAYIAYNSAMTMNEQAVVENNQSDNDGGGIYLYADTDNTSNLNMNDSVKVSGNSAQHNGGGVYILEHAILNVEGTDISFDNNTSKNDGGAIYTENVDNYKSLTASDYQNLRISESTKFVNNKAKNSYLPPENTDVYVNLKFASSSIYNHLLNNYDINYVNEERELYTITYKNIDDTTGYKMTYLKTDDTYKLPIPKRDGFTFTHWLDSENKVATELSKGSTGNKEFTAVWEKVTEPTKEDPKDDNKEEPKDDDGTTVIKGKETDDKEKIVETGDQSNYGIWLIAILVSGSVVLLIRNKTTKENK